jgi:hypothetical protein
MLSERDKEAREYEIETNIYQQKELRKKVALYMTPGLVTLGIGSYFSCRIEPKVMTALLFLAGVGTLITFPVDGKEGSDSDVLYIPAFCSMALAAAVTLLVLIPLGLWACRTQKKSAAQAPL